MKDHIRVARGWYSAHLALGAMLSITELFHVFAMYRDGNRHYHTIAHVAACLRFIERYRKQLSDREYAMLIFALIYHDCVYSITSKVNEEQSQMAFAEYAAGRILPAYSSVIFDLILATKKHTLGDDAPLLFRCMIDADMHVFAGPGCDYIRYAKGIAAEYATHDTIPAFVKGRLAFLDTVDPDHIFYTDGMKMKTWQVKENLELERRLLQTRPHELLDPPEEILYL
jgi:predicted metal-dependent HD superfamily phosphohydrolase